MPRRLDKTPADYVAIAVSPALIMLMVGSLVYFLVAVFYDGPYEGRLYYVLGLFTFAAVLIGRIAIEEGKERAAAFALALALAAGLVLNRLAGPLLFHWVMLGLVWWSAYRLTWDCTLIDEQEDSSGQGLLQVVGLAKRAGVESVASPDAPPQPEGVTSRPGDSPNDRASRKKRKRKPHAPGVWIVYFALAALPLFGLGQKFIPAGDLVQRQWAFRLLLVYVASALGLLLTTSFLGLRRYLRQRRVEMPAKMAGAWMALGGVLIVVLLLLSALLPRPGAEYAVSRVPFKFTSPPQQSSKHGWGAEGAERNRPDSPAVTEEGRKDVAPGKQSGRGEASGGRQGDRAQSPEARSQGNQGGGKSSSDRSSQGSPQQGGRENAPGQGKSGQEKSGQGKSGQEKSGQEKSGQGKSGQEKSPQGKSGQGKSPQGNSPQNASDKGSSRQGKSGQAGASPSDSAPSGKQTAQEQQGGKASQEQQSEQESRSSPSGASRRSADQPTRGGGRSTSRQERPAGTSTGKRQRQAGEDSPHKEEPKKAPKEASKDAPKEASKKSPTAARPPRRSFTPPIGIQLVGGWLGALFKLILYAVVLGVIAYLAWKNWPQVVAAMRQLIADLRNLWASLFGGKKAVPAANAEAEETTKPPPPPRPFADYADPFASGAAARWTADQLVCYTFEALEAWARENGCRRQPDQTPHEFAYRVGGHVESLGEDSLLLAGLYSRVAYAPGTLPRESAAPLERLWTRLRPRTTAAR